MGWTYNVVDPDTASNAPTIAAVGIVFTVISALVVSLRLYVRSSIVKKIHFGECSKLGIVGWNVYLIEISDDWLIVATWVCDMGYQSMLRLTLYSFCRSFSLQSHSLVSVQVSKVALKVSDVYLETRWGLGLQDVDDMPYENLYYFGLVGHPSSQCATPLTYLSYHMPQHHCRQSQFPASSTPNQLYVVIFRQSWDSSLAYSSHFSTWLRIASTDSQSPASQ